MSQTESPIRATFDAQRTAITQGRQMIKQGIAFQRNVGTMSASSLQGLESLQRQQLELARAMTKSYYDGMEALTGVEVASDQEQAIVEAYTQLEETHAEYFEVLERELDRGVDSFDELSEEYVEALEEGTDQLLESHRTIEDQTVRNAEELSEGMLDGLERSQEVLDQLEDQFERQTERTEQLFERQVEGAAKFQEQLEEETEQLQQEMRERVDADEGPIAAVEAARGGSQGSTQQQSSSSQQGSSSQGQTGTEQSPELEEIDGLGSTFRERLADADIESMDDLASASAEQVADAADVSEDRAEEWIDEAGS